jgi:porphobilinogen deaminase
VLGIVLGNLLMMRAAVIAPDGSRRFVEELYGPAEEAEAVGQGLAQQLLAAGAHMFLP